MEEIYFNESQFDRLLESLQRIAVALEKQNDLKEVKIEPISYEGNASTEEFDPKSEEVITKPFHVKLQEYCDKVEATVMLKGKYKDVNIRCEKYINEFDFKETTKIVAERFRTIVKSDQSISNVLYEFMLKTSEQHLYTI